MADGIIGVVRADTSRGNKTRRSWSDREEEVLLRCLKEIVAEGWKSDNGFRAGYLNRLEGMMVRAFPGTDLKAIPHINSKVHVWKKDYGSLVTMLTKSGIGFCHGTNMIEATDEAWANHVKVDTNARLMRYKAWPMFKDWLEVFGKDRATGEGAKDVMEAAQEIRQESTPQNKDKVIQDNANDDEHIEQEGDNTSVFNSSMGQSEKTTSGKKRKHSENDNMLIDVLGKFLENTERRMSEIASRIGYEQDAKAARKELFHMMQSIEGLTPSEKMKVADMMVQNTERLEFFQSLPVADIWTRLEVD